MVVKFQEKYTVNILETNLSFHMDVNSDAEGIMLSVIQENLVEDKDVIKTGERNKQPGRPSKDGLG